jgi:hypothetical protein
MNEVWLRYEISIEGHLAPRRLRHFQNMMVRQEVGGKTVIVGGFRDQSALFGLLNWLQSLGISLVSVRRLEGRDVPDAGGNR